MRSNRRLSHLAGLGICHCEVGQKTAHPRGLRSSRVTRTAARGLTSLVLSTSMHVLGWSVKPLIRPTSTITLPAGAHLSHHQIMPPGGVNRNCFTGRCAAHRPAAESRPGTAASACDAQPRPVPVQVREQVILTSQNGHWPRPRDSSAGSSCHAASDKPPIV